MLNRHDLWHTFNKCVGDDPIDFQLVAGEILLNGTNVVLQAPTGAGKTLCALVPFIYAKHQRLDFADRLIYALPQRTLALALYTETQQLLKERAPSLGVTIQTGNMPEDGLFHKGDIIFTTIDQLLSAYIGVPVSLPRNSANMPGAALLGAYVVFDEFHLLEPGRSLATTLDLAQRLSRFTRLLLMSATVPAQLLQDIAARVRAGIVEVKGPDLAAIKSQRNKTRWFRFHDEALTAAHILAAHTNRSIAVVNRVQWAQHLFRDVQRLAQEHGITDKVLLLHSRFLPKERQAKERTIVEHFGKGGTGHAILLATNVIEVGMDISSEMLHTDLAPANAIFQRAGRCARHEGESGAVHVYALPKNAAGAPIYHPYVGEDDKDLVDRTATELAAHDHTLIGFAEEKAIIDRVHTTIECKRLNTISPLQRQVDVSEAMRTGAGEYIRTLIRHADSINVLVHDRPDTLRMDRAPQTFSVSRNVMKTYVRRLGGDITGRDILWVLSANDDSALSLAWKPVRHVNDLIASLYVCVAPSHAHYDSDIGLVLEAQMAPSPFRSEETRTAADIAYEAYSYARESYEDHVGRTLVQHDAQVLSCRIATQRLADAFGLTEDDLHALSRLVAALHDTGKLASQWQHVIWRWQQEVVGERRTGFLAHSTFDGNNWLHRQRRREAQYRLPPHAAEGAFASCGLLNEWVRATAVPEDDQERILWAMVSAIARHHSPYTTTLSDFTVPPPARAKVAELLGRAAAADLLDKPTPMDRDDFADRLVLPSRGDSFLLYLYLARRLRIADRLATSLSTGEP